MAGDIDSKMTVPQGEARWSKHPYLWQLHTAGPGNSCATDVRRLALRLDKHSGFKKSHPAGAFGGQAEIERFFSFDFVVLKPPDVDQIEKVRNERN